MIALHAARVVVVDSLLVGTRVTVKLDLWRNGMLAGDQTDSDPDAHDSYTFTWTVTQDDYDRLFPDIAVTAGTPTGGVATAAVTSGTSADEGQLVSVTAATEGTKSVSLNEASLAKIASANASTDSTTALKGSDPALTITYPDVGLTFSKDAMDSIQSKLGDEAIDVSATPLTIKAAEVSVGDLNETQQAKMAGVTKADPNAIFFEFTAKVGETAVDFNGKVTVSVPFIGDANRTYSVYFLADDGSVTRIPATIVNGTLTFSTTHFSVYYVTSAVNPAPAGDGGGGGAAVVSTVNVAKTTNGTVKVSSTAAKAGDKVTVTLAPQAGYAVGTVTAKDKNGSDVALTKNADGTYSFTMPESAKHPVDVSAAFTKIADADIFDSYSDLSKDAWYREGVKYALENGVMNGMGDGTFAPNGTTTRAMIAQILWNLEGNPAYVGTSEYADVDNAAWYDPAVRWASAEGIITGYDNPNGKGVVFNPNGAVTREQLATMLYRYAQYKNIDVSVGADTNILSYEDALSVSTWAMAALQWACRAGVDAARENGEREAASRNDKRDGFSPCDTRVCVI